MNTDMNKNNHWPLSSLTNDEYKNWLLQFCGKSEALQGCSQNQTRNLRKKRKRLESDKDEVNPAGSTRVKDKNRGKETVQDNRMSSG